MRKTKKIIVLIMALSLMCGCLSGCGNGNVHVSERKPDAAEVTGEVGEDMPMQDEEKQEAKIEAVPTEPVEAAVTEKRNKAEVLGAAVLPEEQAQYPSPEAEFYWDEYDAWRAGREAAKADAESIDTMKTFYSKLAPVMGEFSTGKNVIYSPLNIWFAMSLLAEVTDGNTKNQVLSVLGTDEKKLCETVNDLWRANYIDDGIVKSLLANSIWLRNNSKYVNDTVNLLAEKYYASSFSGEMGSKEYNDLLHKWLNENTGNLLQDAANGVNFNPAIVFALASTIYFKAPWAEGFSEGRTEEKVFHGVNGDEQFTFLGRSDNGYVYVGKDYTAVEKRFAADGGSMWFILPNEGVTPEEVMISGDYERLLFDNERPDGIAGSVNLSVPKFDVEFNSDIVGAFAKMGITDVCTPGVADFTPIMGMKTDTYLDEVIHAARVKIDEDGVEAAAFTVMMMKNSAFLPVEEIDFTVDRPFVFVITNSDNVPTFAGTVNTLK